MAKEFLRIALLLRTQCAHSREALRGIIDVALPHQTFSGKPARGSQLHNLWTFKLFSQLEHLGTQSLMKDLREFNPDGLIFETFDESMCRQIYAMPRPMVQLFQYVQTPARPTVRPDDIAIGKLAADYLMELNFKHFAFFGSANYEYSRMRRVGFEQGLDASCLSKKEVPSSAAAVLYYDRRTAHWRKHVGRWIASLPRPVAIFAANDLFATEILQELRRQNVRVPEDAALLGVDNDDLQCGLTNPPISSVRPGFRQIGTAAALLLQQMLSNGHTIPTETIIAPLGVIARQSTDIIHVSDRDVAAALKYIRSHALSNLSVKQLVQRVPTNRRRLEKKFAELLGRTLLDEIHRVRIAKVQELLIAGKTIEQIAREMDFSSSKYMTTVFHRVTGRTPSAYQQRIKDPLLTIGDQ